MNKQLTDKKFWENYWKSRDSVQTINKNFAFHNLFHETLKNKKYKTMVEIGGFPGNYAVYFLKYWGYRPTILDSVIELRVINKLFSQNNVKIKNVDIVRGDFFKHRIAKKYDVVFSLGFVEHFDNAEDVIKRHWKMVNKGGQMIVGIPNFLGINGIYQLLFDPSNLNIHNLDSMQFSRITKIVDNLKPKMAKVFYVNNGLVWLENLNNKRFSLRVATRILNSFGVFLNWLGVRNQMISTYLFIIAEK